MPILDFLPEHRDDMPLFFTKAGGVGRYFLEGREDAWMKSFLNLVLACGVVLHVVLIDSCTVSRCNS